jgi:aspartyl-tRNA(Asn)/glutamyl-tRNA(Gln) amidotransferase subunit C
MAWVAITREQVLHVAKLAQLGLSEDEVTRLSEQLSAILESVGKIAELDLAGIEPTSHPLDIVNAFGEDELELSLSLEDALANAPDPEDGSFGVPTP